MHLACWSRGKMLFATFLQSPSSPTCVPTSTFQTSMSQPRSEPRKPSRCSPRQPSGSAAVAESTLQILRSTSQPLPAPSPVIHQFPRSVSVAALLLLLRKILGSTRAAGWGPSRRASRAHISRCRCRCALSPFSPCERACTRINYIFAARGGGTMPQDSPQVSGGQPATHMRWLAKQAAFKTRSPATAAQASGYTSPTCCHICTPDRPHQLAQQQLQ